MIEDLSGIVMGDRYDESQKKHELKSIIDFTPTEFFRYNKCGHPKGSASGDLLFL